MNFCSADRAQSLQVGAVLLFGFLVLGLTIFQAEAVPEENKQVEFDHSQAVAEEMIGLYTAIFDTVTDGRPRTASITLGTDYNNRIFFIYPPPASGALQTTDESRLQFHNVTAVESPEINQSFDNYWANETRNYTTRAITYSPNYRELRGTADYRIEYGALAAQYPESTQLRIAPRHKPVVDGTEINLVVFDGELQEISPDTKAVIPERVTDSTQVTVRNGTDTSGIRLNLSTELPEESWNTSADGSLLEGEQYVEDVTVENGNASILLNGTETYTLTLHKVDLGINATAPAPTYLRNVSYNGTHATFEVRDEFNDRVDRPVDGWVYNKTDSETAEDDFEIVDGRRVDNVTDINDEPLCFTIEEDVVNATAYETIDINDGCPA